MSVGERWPEAGLESVPACPACGSDRRRVLYRGLADIVFHAAPGRWVMERCCDCGCAYLNPRPTPETILLAYRQYYTHVSVAQPDKLGGSRPRRLDMVARNLRNDYLNARYGHQFTPACRLGRFLFALMPLARRRADRAVRYLPASNTGGRLLDVGCGNGAFLAQARDMGWDVAGVEPDPEAAHAAQGRGLPVFVGRFEDAFYADQSFDVITLNHVIEHVHDPLDILRRCRRLVRPEGTLWISTPNINSCAHSQFRQAWRGLEPPRHLTLFTPGSLERLCRKAGFQRTRWGGMPDAQWHFSASYAIREEAASTSPSRPMPLTLQVLARIANEIGVISPGRAEEIVMWARASG